MDMAAFLSSDMFTILILPVLIFISRILDVSIGTLRVIFISKGFKYIAPVLGFFEVTIWLLAITKIMQNLSNVFCYLGYGLGFAAGTFVGMYLEEKISIGKVLVRVISKKDASELLENLKLAKYHVTGIEAEGDDSRVKVIFTVADRKDVPEFLSIVKHFNPKAFYTIEDVRFASSDSIKSPVIKRRFQNIFGFYRKGK